jgi:hypothetical protein
MNDDKAWDRIMDAIDAKYGIEKHGRSQRSVEDSNNLTESVAFIEFTRNGERFKLERIHGPAIIDRKTIGARRAGAVVRYQNVYDPTETSFRTVLYRTDEAGDWEETSADALGIG